MLLIRGKCSYKYPRLERTNRRVLPVECKFRNQVLSVVVQGLMRQSFLTVGVGIITISQNPSIWDVVD